MTSALTLHGIIREPEDLAWSRPADWLTLPGVVATDQKFVGLHAVFPHDSNFCAIQATGAYTVDWGDGSAPENITSGTIVYHKFDYSAAVLVGTECSRGYRQAIVTVTPQAGQTLTSLTLTVKHNQSLLQAYSMGWLDIDMSAPSLTTLALANSATVLTKHLEQVSLRSCAMTTGFSNLFGNCYALQSVPILATATGTNFSGMFSTCSALRTVTLFDTSAGTNFSNMFASCKSLRTVPLFNTGAGTNFASMFNSCSNLRSIPLLNTAGGLDFNNMFQACTSLRTIPLLNTGAATIMNNMFSGCSSLETIPLLNTAANTTFLSFFNGCSNLREVPLLNTAAGTTFSSMFSGCTSLTEVPLFNTSAGTNFSSMFNNCQRLTTIPLFNTAAGTSFGTMVASCTNLQSVPALQLGAATNAASYTNMFFGCTSLSSIGCLGIKFTFSVTSCRLSPAALDALYTNLATVVSQTVTVTNNWGTSIDNPSIATAKGWTVTG